MEEQLKGQGVIYSPVKTLSESAVILINQL